MASAATAGVKVITEPTIYTLARTVIEGGGVNFLDAIGSDWCSDTESEADYLAEFAGRVCYMSFDPKKQRPGGNAAYIGHILEVGHGSVLEHASWSFLFTGVSRSLTHELVRHRAGMSYSELSQRFVDSSDVAFVVPPALMPSKEAHGFAERFRKAHLSESDEDWRAAVEAGYLRYGRDKGHPANLAYAAAEPWETWLSACEDSLEAYRTLLARLREDMPEAARKEVHEAARSVLPNCTETRVVVTGNGRSWRHFLHLRGSAGADAEIRRLARALAPILKADAPAIFADVTVTDAGTVEVGHPC